VGKQISAAPTWDDYFVQVARSVSVKSKDPNCKVGAVIVNDDELIVSTGFNGIARRLEDDQHLLGDKFAKLGWMVHAEQNAIINAARSGVRTLGCKIYVTKFPCFACLQVIVQAGIPWIYTDDNDYWNNDPIDPTHDGKRYVIKEARLTVVAPNHPEYKRPARPSLAPQAGPKPRKADPTRTSGAAFDEADDITEVKTRSVPPPPRQSGSGEKR